MQEQYGITRKQFFKIVYADPTAKVIDNILIGGKYTDWLLKHSISHIITYGKQLIYQSLIGRFLQEDIGKATADLVYYKNNIKKFLVSQRDINKIDGFDELYNVVQSVRSIETTNQLKKFARTQMNELFTGNSNKRVFRPESKQASIFLGKNTKLCIAATESKNWFDLSEGYLYYVFIRKEDGAIEKFAFRFEDSSYYDQLSNVIDDVHGFFKEHPEVANAIAKDRKSILSEKECVPDLLVLNQLSLKKLTRDDMKYVSWWYVYNAVQNGQLSNEEGNALLPKDFGFKFCGEHQAAIVVDDWNALKYFADFYRDDETCLIEYLNGEMFEIMDSVGNEARIQAARDAVRKTLSITSDKQIEVDSEFKLEITVDLNAFPQEEIFRLESASQRHEYSYLSLFLQRQDDGFELYSPNLSVFEKTE